MKLTLKLLILTAILVAVAGLCGGWKWDAKSGTKKAAHHALVAANPDGAASSAPTAASITLEPVDPNGSASSPSTDAPITLAPADPNGPVSISPADTSFTPDGWTWD
jgi:hypothetical protein